MDDLDSSLKTWMAKITFFVFFLYPHIKLSRFINHTVQKFFRVQILWIGISWYIHYIFWMAKIRNHRAKVLFLCPVRLHHSRHAPFTLDRIPLTLSPLHAHTHALSHTHAHTHITEMASSHLILFSVNHKIKSCFVHTVATFPTGAVLHHQKLLISRKNKKQKVNSNLILSLKAKIPERAPCAGFL